MIYLHDFEFQDERHEELFIEIEKRTCYRNMYPLRLFPLRGLRKLEFSPVTIIYGGNGSGKSTVLNIIAERLGVLRELPFAPSHFFDWYVNGAEGYDAKGNWINLKKAVGF